MMLSTIETVTVEVLSAPFFVLEDDEVTSVIETTCSESDSGLSDLEMSDSSGHPDSPPAQVVPARSCEVIPNFDLELAFQTDVAIAHHIPPPPPPLTHPLDLLGGKFLNQLNYRPPLSSYLHEVEDGHVLAACGGLTVVGWLKPAKTTTKRMCVMEIGNFMR